MRAVGWLHRPLPAQNERIHVAFREIRAGVIFQCRIVVCVVAEIGMRTSTGILRQNGQHRECGLVLPMVTSVGSIRGDALPRHGAVVPRSRDLRVLL